MRISPPNSVSFWRKQDESVYWLELLATSGVVPQEKLAPLLNEAEQLDAIFAASRITAQATAKAHAAG
jgi:hypothetical protein